MKKIGVILLLLIYAGSTSGVILHLHYCCGRLAGVDLTKKLPAKYVAGQKVVTQSRGCCGDKHIQVKVDDDHQKAEVAKSLNAPFTDLAWVPFPEFKADYYTIADRHIGFGHAPPLLPPSRPLYLVQGVFRI